MSKAMMIPPVLIVSPSHAHGGPQGPQGRPLGQQGVLGVLDGHPLAPELVSGLQLGQQAEVRGDDGGDLRIAAGGLPVAEHDDGLSGGGGLPLPLPAANDRCGVLRNIKSGETRDFQRAIAL